VRESKGAIFNTDPVALVDADTVRMLKERAELSESGRFRLCLHESTDDSIQDMVIAERKGAYCRPHRHPGRESSLYIIEGATLVIVFDEKGAVLQRAEMGAIGSGKPFCIRFAPDVWHMDFTISASAVFREVLAGPNANGEALMHAAWSPEFGDAEGIRAFLRRIGVSPDGADETE